MAGSPPPDYSEVTEVPGTPATQEQLARLYHRYHTGARSAQGRRVLEVACGAGMGLGFLAHTASQVTGGDFTAPFLKMAQSHYRGRIPLLRLDAHHLPFCPGAFDLVIILEAIYYLRDAAAFVAEVRRVLDKNGLLFISTVNKAWTGCAASSLTTRFFSVPELRDLLLGSGFTNLEFYGAFPAEPNSFREKLTSLIRRVVIALHLMPKTLGGRAPLKRLFYGRLTPLPPEVTEGMSPLYPLEKIKEAAPTHNYKIVYCVARNP